MGFPSESWKAGASVFPVPTSLPGWDRSVFGIALHEENTGKMPLDFLVPFREKGLAWGEGEE